MAVAQRQFKAIDTAADANSGFFQTYHALREQLGRGRLSGALQQTICNEILAESLGQPPKKRADWAHGLTMSHFAKRAGMGAKGDGLSEGATQAAVQDLVDRGMIARERDGRGWKYRLTPERWRSAAKYQPKKVEAVPPPPVETPTEAKPVSRFVLMPGKSSRAMPLPEAIAKYQFTSTARAPIRFDVGIVEGVLRFRAYDDEASKQTNTRSREGRSSGEQRANLTSYGDGVSRRPSHSNQRVTGREIDNSDPLYDFLDRTFSHRLHERPSAKIVAEIRRALGPVALQALADHVRLKVTKVKSYGILPLFAAEVRKAHERTAEHARSQESNRSIEIDEERYRAVLQIWDELTPEQREEYRGWMPDRSFPE